MLRPTMPPPPPPPSPPKTPSRQTQQQVTNNKQKEYNDNLNHRRGSQFKFAKQGVSGLMKRAQHLMRKKGEHYEILAAALDDLQISDLPKDIKADDPFVIRVLTHFFNLTDVDKSGGISPVEFMNATSMIGDKLGAWGEKFCYRKVTSMFASLDLDSDGLITLSELIDGSANINNHEFILVCAAVDVVYSFFEHRESEVEHRRKSVFPNSISITPLIIPKNNDSDETTTTTTTTSTATTLESLAGLPDSEESESEESFTSIIKEEENFVRASDLPSTITPPIKRKSKWNLFKQSSDGDGSIVIKKKNGDEVKVSKHDRSSKKTTQWNMLAQTLKDKGMISSAKSPRRLNAASAARSGTYRRNSMSGRLQTRKRLANLNNSNEGTWVNNLDDDDDDDEYLELLNNESPMNYHDSSDSESVKSDTSRSNTPHGTPRTPRGNHKLKGVNHRVQVVVRLRPPLPGEETDNELFSNYNSSTNTIHVNGGVTKFDMDHLFTPDSKQNEVFHIAAKPVADQVLLGYNGTILAYGATGTGKTHTMIGERSNDGSQAGIIPRTLKYIFRRASNSKSRSRSRSSSSNYGDRKSRSSSVSSTSSLLSTPLLDDNDEYDYTFSISYLELYGTTLTDLLDPTKTNLKIIQSKSLSAANGSYGSGGGIVVQGLSKIPVTSVDEAMTLMAHGERSRAYHETNLNAQSSRSHVIFVLNTTKTKKNRRISLNKTVDAVVSQLYMVDLAGSERVNKSGATGAQLTEAISINKSLAALGNCINALASSKTNKHIPYRSSKLTHLLSSNLGGNAKMVLVVCVGPRAGGSTEMLSALHFGQRAKRVKVDAQINKVTKNGEAGENYEQLYNDAKNKLLSSLSLISSYEDQIEQLFLEKDNQKMLIEEKVIQNEKDGAIIKKLNDTINQEKLKMNESMNTIDELKTNLNDSNILVKEYKEKNTELENVMNDFKTFHSTLKKDMEDELNLLRKQLSNNERESTSKMNSMMQDRIQNEAKMKELHAIQMNEMNEKNQAVKNKMELMIAAHQEELSSMNRKYEKDMNQIAIENNEHLGNIQIKMKNIEREQLQQYRDEKEKLKTSYETNLQEVKELNDTNCRKLEFKHEMEINKLTKKYEDLNNQYKNEHETFKKKVAREKENQEKMKNEMHIEMKRNKSKYENELLKLSNELQEYQVKVDTMKENDSTLRKELLQEKEQCVNEKHEKNELLHNIKKQKMDTIQLQKDKETLKEELKNTITKHKNEINTSSAKCALVEKKLIQLEQEKSNESTKYNLKMKQSSETIQSLRKESMKLKNEHAHAIKEYQNNIETIKNSNVALKYDVVQLNSSIKQLKDELNKEKQYYTDEIELATESTNQLQNNIKLLENSNQELKKTMKENHEKYQQAMDISNHTIASLKKDAIQFQKTVEQLKEKNQNNINLHNIEISKKTNELHTSKMKVIALDKTIKELHKNNMNTNNINITLTNEKTQLLNKRDNLQSELNSLKTNYSTNLIKIQNFQNNHEVSLETIKSLKNELLDVQNTFNEAKLQIQKNDVQHARDMNALLDEKNELNDSLISLKEQYMNHEKNLKNENFRLMNEIKTSSIEYATTKGKQMKEINELKEEIQIIQNNTFNDKKKAANEIAFLKNEIKLFKENLNNRKEEHEYEKMKYAKEMKNKMVSLKEEQKREMMKLHDTNTSTNNELRNQVQKLVSQVNDQKILIRSMENTNEQLKQHVMNEKEKYANELDIQKRKLHTINIEMMEIKESNKTLTNTIDVNTTNYENELDAISNELKTTTHAYNVEKVKNKNLLLEIKSKREEYETTYKNKENKLNNTIQVLQETLNKKQMMMNDLDTSYQTQVCKLQELLENGRKDLLHSMETLRNDHSKEIMVNNEKIQILNDKLSTNEREYENNTNIKRTEIRNLRSTNEKFEKEIDEMSVKFNRYKIQSEETLNSLRKDLISMPITIEEYKQNIAQLQTELKTADTNNNSIQTTLKNNLKDEKLKFSQLNESYKKIQIEFKKYKAKSNEICESIKESMKNEMDTLKLEHQKEMTKYRMDISADNLIKEKEIETLKNALEKETKQTRNRKNELLLIRNESMESMNKHLIEEHQLQEELNQVNEKLMKLKNIHDITINEREMLQKKHEEEKNQLIIKHTSVINTLKKEKDDLINHENMKKNELIELHNQSKHHFNSSMLVNKKRYEQLKMKFDEYKDTVEKDIVQNQKLFEDTLLKKENEWNNLTKSKIKKMELNMIELFRKERDEIHFKYKSEMNKMSNNEKIKALNEVNLIKKKLNSLRENEINENNKKFNTTKDIYENNILQLKNQLNDEKKKHEETLIKYDAVQTQFQTHAKDVENRLLKLKKELMNNKKSNSAVNVLKNEIQVLKNSYNSLKEKYDDEIANKYKYSELVIETEFKLKKSEQVRRSLRSTVKKVTDELHKIRSTGYKLKKNELIMEKKEKKNVTLRLKYEKLLSKYKTLKDHVYEYEFEDVLHPETLASPSKQQSPIALVLKNATPN
jgi:kinesin family member 5